MPSSPSTPPEHTGQPASSEEAVKMVQDTIHRIGESLEKQQGGMKDMKDKLGEVLENSSCKSRLSNTTLVKVEEEVKCALTAVSGLIPVIAGLGGESGEALKSCNAVFDSLKLQLEAIMNSDSEDVSPGAEDSRTREGDVPTGTEGARAEVQDAQTQAEDL